MNNTTQLADELEKMMGVPVRPRTGPNPHSFLLEHSYEIITHLRDLAALRAREAARPVCGKTADGVEVRAGDRVYMSDNHREWYAAIAGTAMADGSYLRLVTDCYSTPEAARAAGEKT